MNYKLISRPEGVVAEYAAAELYRCLSLMDPSLCEGEGGIELSLVMTGTDPAFDTVQISVTDGRGTIGGANPGALLIAVYRFLFELGCRWTHPGDGGEHIPQKALTPDLLNVNLTDTPSRSHRGVCIEGAVSEENVRDMIEFLPRVGMNSYFVQFFRPSTFLNRWYTHEENPFLEGEEKTNEEIDAIYARLIDEILKRGIRYHAVGHGWTAVPFGVESGGWQEISPEGLPQEYVESMAMLNGKRALYRNVPLDTNLCYSNPKVRSKVADAVVEYAKKTPAVDVIHIWLADGSNNNCECEECCKARPSDHYVKMLNEVDRKLTEAGLDTKIVFLVYVDLLWAPEQEVIKNPDRFLIMFAPITRTYSQTLRQGARSATVERLPYVRNKLKFPKDVATNISYLNDWRRAFSGSGFIFDYHLMWDHFRDPGYMQAAHTLFEDMKDLDLLNLDGMISCQLTRSAFPTGLPIYAMARALWDKNADFDAVADEYFAAEFGELAGDVRAYLTELSRLFDPPYIRREKPRESEESAAIFDTIPAFISKFRSEHPEIRVSSDKEPLRVLAVHADYCMLLSLHLARRARNENMEDTLEALRAFAFKNEPLVQNRFDAWNLFNHELGHSIR